MWNPGTVPFVIFAILVATGPVIYATRHTLRYGHMASLFERGHKRDPAHFGWEVCPECKAVIVDPVEHKSAVHDYSAASLDTA